MLRVPCVVPYTIVTSLHACRHELVPRLRAAALVAVALYALLASSAYGAQPRLTVDSIAERVVPCTSCHGKEGRATSEGYFPRIAGKPAGYLYNQLLNFRDGRRQYALMTYLVDHLTDSYLREIAEYFAALNLPYPQAQPASGSRALRAAGEVLVKRGDAARSIPACVECHGRNLMGTLPSVPGLLGLSRDYLHGQLGHWQTGTRRAHPPDCMAKIAAKLTPEDITALAVWIAGQPVPQGASAAQPLQPAPMDCGGLSR
jgi:cytochrome c553